MNPKEKILEVLKKGFLMSLATSDSGGVWVADVIYVYDENFNLYFMSDPEVRHSKAIGLNSQVAGAITVTNNGEKNELGVQFSGRAHKIDGARFDLAQKLYNKKGKELSREEEDVLQGDSWYEIKLEKVELIDVENLGWDKESVEI